MKKPNLRSPIGTTKELLVVALIVIIAWKLLITDFSFSFQDIKTNDVLAFLLALFAIGLSVSFYIKANSVSNKFYDNMYKFTKDNSELLGRMEAGFSEQLRHLDQGYLGLSDKFDKLPLDLGKTREKVEDEKIEVKKLKKDNQALLDKLAERANLEAEEKDRLFQRINSGQRELSQAERQLIRLQHQLRDAQEADSPLHSIDGILVRTIKYTQRKIIDLLDLELIESATDDELRNAWDLISNELNRTYLNDLRKSAIIDDANELTQKGLEFLRRAQNYDI